MKYKVFDKIKGVWDDSVVIDQKGTPMVKDAGNYEAVRFLHLRDRFSTDLYSKDVIKVYLNDKQYICMLDYLARFGAVFQLIGVPQPIEDELLIREDDGGVDMIECERMGNILSEPHLHQILSK
jgi:hypothetical protein